MGNSFFFFQMMDLFFARLRLKRIINNFRAQLFEGRLALNPGLNVTQVSFSLISTFKRIFSDNFLCYF